MTPSLSRPMRRNVIIIGFAFFALGALFMRPIASWLRPDPSSPTHTPAAEADDYQTYALLLVDDFSIPQPQVDGVWLAWIPADYSTLELIGIPPTPFRGEYSHDLKGVPTLSLQPYLRGNLGGSFVLDRADLVELAEQVGGVRVEGAHIQGEALLNYYLNPELEPDDSLIRQAAVLQSLVAQIAVRGTNISYEALLQVPSLCTILHDPLYEAVGHYYPLHTDQIQVRVLLVGMP